MNTQKGFTLIELMIVIAIIGILAAIAIPQYQNYIAKSQVSRVMGELGNLKTAVETCYLDGKAATCELGATKSNLLGALTDVTTFTSTTNPGLSVKIESEALAPTATTNSAEIKGTFGTDAATAIKGKYVQWTRDAAGSWACTTDVDAKYKPTSCGAAATTPVKK